MVRGRPKNDTPLTNEQVCLIADNYLLILKCMNKYLYIYPFLSKETVWDVCVDAVINSARLFDERKGKLSTLYYQAVKSDIGRITKRYNAEITECCSLDKLNESDSDIYNILGKEDKYHFIDKDLVERLVVDITEKERTYMYKHFVLGESKTDISKTHNVTPQAVHQTINNAIKRIRTSEVFLDAKKSDWGCSYGKTS